MVTMAQSAANWRNTHTHVDCTHLLTHFTSTQLQPRNCAKRQLSYYGIWNRIFILKVREGEGANRSTRRKIPDILPANRYHIIIREKNPTSRAGIEPSPCNIGDKLAWPRARAASDPPSYSPPLRTLTEKKTHAYHASR